MQIKSHQNCKIWLSILVITAMVAVEELLGDKEVIFPEMAALTIGAWIADKQPWNVSKPRILAVMTISSLIGWSISSLLEIPLFFKLIIGLVLCIILLLVSQTTMLPLMSATILPILIGAKSIVYPLSVIILTVLIVLLQLLLEKYGFRSQSTYIKIKYHWPIEFSRWLLIITVFALTALIVLPLDLPFIIAPPLIVAFCEFSYFDSLVRKSPMVLWLLIAACTVIGTSVRYILCLHFGLPLYAAAFLITVIVLYSMSLLKKLFPPAGALAILPLIIDEKALLWYPLEVMTGAALLITISMLYGIISKKILHNIKQEANDEILL